MEGEKTAYGMGENVYRLYICITFCLALIKHHGQGNLSTKEFIWAHASEGIRTRHGREAQQQEGMMAEVKS